MLHTPLTSALRGWGLAVVGLVAIAMPGFALEPPVMMKESRGQPMGGQVPCLAPASIDGTCGNYRWYNFCSGYVWIYSGLAFDQMGVSFLASEGMPCIAPGNIVKRAITYWRLTFPNYNQTVNIYLARDTDSNHCPDGVDIAQDLNMDPGERWNCSEFNAVIPPGVNALVVSQRYNGGFAPSPATDTGPPCRWPTPHSFYYGVNRELCVPWADPAGAYNNFPTWLVIDEPPTATQPTTWGGIKGLYR